MTAGTFNVNNLSVGGQQTNNSANVSGIVNVNGTATLISTNTGITLAHIVGSGGSGVTSGTLNINNGTVFADIAAGGGTSTVNLNAGTLEVPAGGTVGTSAAPLTALNFTGGSLELNVNGTASTSIVDATTVTASGTAISIASLTNVTSSNAVTIHLISYTGSDPFAGFSLAALPYGYAGNLVDNTGNSSIDLRVMTAALPPPPTIGSIIVHSGQVIIGSVSNSDVAGGSFSVLTTTNVALPLADWTLLTRGTFGTNGNFSFTNAAGTNGQQYYILRLP